MGVVLDMKQEEDEEEEAGDRHVPEQGENIAQLSISFQNFRSSRLEDCGNPIGICCNQRKSHECDRFPSAEKSRSQGLGHNRENSHGLTHSPLTMTSIQDDQRRRRRVEDLCQVFLATWLP